MFPSSVVARVQSAAKPLKLVSASSRLARAADAASPAAFTIPAWASRWTTNSSHVAMALPYALIASFLSFTSPRSTRASFRDQAGNVRGSNCAIFAEAGEILAGQKAVPEGATVIYDSVGIAIMDVAAAKLVYDLWLSGG